MSHFYAYLSRMKHILRWSLMRNTQSENIAEHSLQAAMIAHALALYRRKTTGAGPDPQRVATLSLFHDAGEVITGDLATPIKYFNPEIKSAYKEIERHAEHKLLEMTPPDLREEYRDLLISQEKDAEAHALIKAADKLCAYVKCIEELKMGNQEFIKAMDNIKGTLDRMNLPEVDWFLKECVPSFSLTLDELN
jgi:5'-deoxynucleotidase